MQIQFTVDSLDAVDEPLRGLYDEQDGKHVLNFDKYAEHVKAPVVKKNKELLADLTKKKPLVERAEKFKDFADEDLETFAEWKKRREEGGDDDKGKSAEELQRKWQADREKEIAKLKAQHDGEKAALTKERDDAKAAHRSFKLRTMLTTGGVKAGLFEDSVDDFVDLAAKHFRLEDSGEVVFLDKDGDPTDLTFEKAIEKLRDRYPRLFKGDEKGGSGAHANNKGGERGGKKTVTRAAFEQMTPNDRMAHIKAGGGIAD